MISAASVWAYILVFYHGNQRYLRYNCFSIYFLIFFIIQTSVMCNTNDAAFIFPFVIIQSSVYKCCSLYFLCLHIIKNQCNEYYKCYRLWFLVLLIKQAIVTSFSNDIACFFLFLFFSKCYVCYKCYNLYFRVVENFTHDHSQSR